MHPFIALAGLVALAACTPAQTQKALSSQEGQLFCAIQTSGGGAVVAGLVSAEAGTVAGPAAPLAVIATGATKAFVDQACASVGGIPVSPPANPAAAPQVAVVPPKA